MKARIPFATGISFSLITAALVFAEPNFASAQGLVPCSGPDCNACHLVQLGQNVLNFLITLAASVAAIMFAVAGVIYVSAQGDTGKISQAHSIFTNVLIGLVITLSAWLIIDTVMKTLLDEGFSSGLGAWNQVQCR